MQKYNLLFLFVFCFVFKVYANAQEVKMNREVAVFGGGCFWCLEAVFAPINGVLQVVSGYAGGDKENPTYEMVLGGKTGHAEVVQITFNREIINYSKLLEIYFSAHDPTTLNRQGNDIGTQYRSIILYSTANQKEIALEVMKNVQGKLTSPIVTELKPLVKFYPAEDYHQDYYKNNPSNPYCGLVIQPKVEKVKKSFQDLIRKQ